MWASVWILAKPESIARHESGLMEKIKKEIAHHNIKDENVMKPKQTCGPSLFSIVLFSMILFFTGLFPMGLAPTGLPTFGASPANAAVSEDSRQAVSLAYVINIPAKMIQSELKKLILKNPSSAVKEISRFDMDPVQQLAVMAGVIEIPPGEIYPSESKSTGQSLPSEMIAQRHDFFIAISFPSVKLMAKTGYVRFKIVELKLDGHSYLNASRIITNFASVFLRETDFARFILSRAVPDSHPSKKKIKETAAAFIEKKGIILRNGAISLKFDFKQFRDFGKIISIPNLRLWRFEPVWFASQSAFRIEIGIGKPGKQWLKDVEQRAKADNQALSRSRKKEHDTWSDITTFKAEVAEFVEKEKNRMGFPHEPGQMGQMEKSAADEIDLFNRRLEIRARSALSIKNSLFKAWPKKTRQEFFSDIRNDATAFYADLNRRIQLEKAIAQGGRDSYDLPFMETFLSQRAINQAVRYYGNLSINGKNLFSSLNLVLSPQLPGAVIRGAINLDIDYLMDLAARGDEINGDGMQKRMDRLLGGGIPFEAGMRFWMKDENLLSLDMKYVSLFSGQERITLSNHQRHGQFLFNFAKGLLLKSAAAMAISLAPPEKNEAHSGASPGQTGAENEAGKDVATPQEFLKYGHLYTQKKTLIRQGNERMEIFLDTGDETINIKLNPRIAARDIFGMKNDIQAWEFAPVYFRAMDQTFMKIAAGDGGRSSEYVKQISSGELKKDSRAFTGTMGEEGPLDLRIRVNLKEVQDIANKILSHIHDKESGKVQTAIAQNKEGTHYLLKKIGLRVVENRLRMDVAFSRVKISNRWIINPNRWIKSPYRISRKEMSVYADLEIKAVSSEDARLFLENELLSKELLKLDIAGVGFDIENPSLFENIMGHFLGETDLSGGPGGAIKRFLLKKIAPHLNGSGQDEGNTDIAGFRINQFLKIFTHTSEIYLQLNPRFASPAFDVALVPNQNERGEPLGFLIDAGQRKLVFDFSTHGVMPASDKAELLGIAQRADLEFAPYLDEKDPEELVKKLNRLTLFDRAFHNSDELKLSLFHRIKRGMNLYPAMADLVAGEKKSPQVINGGQSRISVTGAEIIYFLSAARSLEKNTRQLLAKLEGMGISQKVQYIESFKEFQKRLKETIITPFAKKYQADHHPINHRMAERGATDWNRPYYEEAAFSAATWEAMGKNCEL